MKNFTRVEWLEWGEQAFSSARQLDRPLLLSLTATWCSDCLKMDRETYTEPQIAAHINDVTVPVRVDVDRRPRIRERYTIAGFPATVFLAPDGSVIAEAGYLTPDEMRHMIESIRHRLRDEVDLVGEVPPSLDHDSLVPEPLTDAIEAHMTGQLEAQWDQQHNGWGDAAKFPLPRAIDFAFKRDQSKACAALKQIGDALWDDTTGGFYRHAHEQDWSAPHSAKLVSVNAALIRSYAHAYAYTGDPQYRKKAKATIEFLSTYLFRENRLDNSIVISQSEQDDRRDINSYAGPNAVAVDALLLFSGYTDDESTRALAVQLLQTLSSTFLTNGSQLTLSHQYNTPSPQNLLEDCAYFLQALVRGYQVLGPRQSSLNSHLLSLACSFADHALDRLQADSGAVLDGPLRKVGLLERPLYPIDLAAELADALFELAHLSDKPRFRTAAREALAAHAGAFDRFGVQLAHYAAVSSRLQRPSLTVDIGSGPNSRLHRAALRIADHEVIVDPCPCGVDSSSAIVRVDSKTQKISSPEEMMTAVQSLSLGSQY